MCSTLGCLLQENTVSVERWNTRPIEDELRARIAELERDLSNKEIEYTDLWDNALALQARIVDLRTLIDRLIKAGNKVIHARPMWVAGLDDWDALVKYWKESEK